MPFLATVDPLVGRLALDLASVGALWAVYRRARVSLDTPFAFVTLNVLTFALASMLSGVTIDLGVSLGLFAIFGVLRYRTEPLDTVDLTYVFLMIGLAMINGIGGAQVRLVELAFLNTVVVVVVAVMERARSHSPRKVYSVRYDRLDLLVPGRRDELMADLEARLGRRLDRVRIDTVDMLMATAQLHIETSEDAR